MSKGAKVRTRLVAGVRQPAYPSGSAAGAGIKPFGPESVPGETSAPCQAEPAVTDSLSFLARTACRHTSCCDNHAPAGTRRSLRIDIE